MPGDDLYKAQAHGPLQDHHGVVQGGEQGGQGKVGLDAGQGKQLGEEVAEEAAGEGSEKKCAHTAQPQQAEQVAHGAAGLLLFQHDQRGQHHHQSIAHVRHHHAVKQDEKGGHQGVGVQGAIGGQGVHLRHHVQGPGEPVVFQLYRHGGVLLRAGLGQLPRRGEGGQCLLHRLPPLRREPAL